MNSLVIAPAAPPAVPREGAPALLAGSPAKAAPVETARAPRPVDPVGAAYRSRGTGRRDQPVGPPPSFAVNVLQDILSRLAEPAPPTDQPPPDVASRAASDAAPESATAKSAGRDVRDIPSPSPSPAAPGADPARSLTSPAVSAERDAPPQPLNRKV